MITFLHGKLVDALPTTVTVDVHGVGYEVLIPLSSFDRLPPVGSEVHLLTHLVVREDAHILYGFMGTAERDLFRLLIHAVSGVGPKLALNVLSGTSVAAGAAGAKGASPADTKLNDAVLALSALGFKPADAHEAVRGALSLLGETATVEQLVRACLKKGA